MNKIAGFDYMLFESEYELPYFVVNAEKYTIGQAMDIYFNNEDVLDAFYCDAPHANFKDIKDATGDTCIGYITIRTQTAEEELPGTLIYETVLEGTVGAIKVWEIHFDKDALYKGILRRRGGRA